MYSPITYDRFISWYTGHGFYIVSQDRKSSFRGPSIDFIFGDESQDLIKDRFEEEVLGTRRGNRKIFGNIHLHHGIHLSGTKPLGSDGRWILDFGKYYQEDGHDYESMRDLLCEVALEIIKSESLSKRKELWKQYVQLKSRFKFYESSEGVLHLESFPFDNVANVGFGYFKNNMKVMSLYRFNIEMLNKTPRKPEGGFYPDFSLHKHCGDFVNYEYLDKIGYDYKKKEQLDSRADSDVDHTKPLHIGMDYGASHNCLVVNQPHQKEIRWLNYFYRLWPDKTKDVVADFCKHYLHHKDKTVYYYFNHTATGTDGKSDYRYCDIVPSVLSKAGWNVISINTGKAPNQSKMYELCSDAFQERGHPAQIFNRNNCKQLFISIEFCKAIQGREGISKDKGKEKDENYPQQDAPHGSEAFDTLIWGQLSKQLHTDVPVETEYR
jgi:hypothetical protein